MQEDTFAGVGGYRIFTRTWRPETPPRAVVVIVHGFNSHSGQYGWVAEQLVDAGFAVYALDLRGRGRSEGERFYVEKFQDYVDDVGTLVRIAKEREPGLPVFMLAHSAGGVIACGYALEHQSELAGLVCEDFAQEVPAPRFVLSILKVLGRIAPHARVYRIKNEDFSRDPVRVDELNQDPLIAGEVQPNQTAAEMIRADERLARSFDRITLPVLILHGTEDHVTRPSGSQRFHDLAGSDDKTLELYEGHYHDLLADLDKELVMADIVGWMDTRIRP
jgi:alpha-beta hydrolase superfamily lysophospholipase